MTSPSVVSALTIAGSDSGGGAGIQADLKAFAAHRVHGLSVIAALTAQNTRGVSAVHVPPIDFLRAQIEACFDDFDIHAVKLGMLANAEVIHAVADALERHRPPHVVLDPVMVATSGDRLIAPDTVQVLVDELFPLATVVTPNLDEAALLLGRPITAAAELEPAARDLLAMGAPAVLLKGGHLPGDEVADLLVSGHGPAQRLASPRISSRNTHGTGCTLSSAIAAHLALGEPLERAVALARRYILQAIAMGADVYTGAGHGPLNHGHAPVAQTKRPRV